MEFYQSLNSESKEKKTTDGEKSGDSSETIIKEKVADGKAI